MAPFLGSTFGFSTAFKLWNVAFRQVPEGAEASWMTFLQWFLLMPEPKYVKGKTRTLSFKEVQKIVLGFIGTIHVRFLAHGLHKGKCSGRDSASRFRATMQEGANLCGLIRCDKFSKHSVRCKLNCHLRICIGRCT